jgi:hypothetical protein
MGDLSPFSASGRRAFTYHPDYLPLSCISTSFHPHETLPKLGSSRCAPCDVEHPTSEYGTLLVIYVGFMTSYTYTFSLLRRLGFDSN